MDRLARARADPPGDDLRRIHLPLDELGTDRDVYLLSFRPGLPGRRDLRRLHWKFGEPHPVEVAGVTSHGLCVALALAIRCPDGPRSDWNCYHRRNLHAHRLGRPLRTVLS